MRRAHQGLALLGVALLAACGSSTKTVDAPPGPPAPAVKVAATSSIKFSPNTVTIQRGGTVTFDFGSVAHNVFFDGAPAGAPANIAGENANSSKTLTFGTEGTFVYNCHIHPGMQGTVVVVGPED